MSALPAPRDPFPPVDPDGSAAASPEASPRTSADTRRTLPLPTRTLALCADDFGASPGISAGIAELARAGRLSAVSCLVNGPHWPAAARLLKALPASVDIGLHLNLTEGEPLAARLKTRWPTFPALPRLIGLAHLRRLPRAELRAEFHAQLSTFIRTVGVAPKFIDGHQHVHHLPVLRDLILDMAEHVQPLPAIRSTGRLIGPGDGWKRWLIEATGGRALARELHRRVLPHNPALLGAYDFAEPDYRRRMQGWLAALPSDGGLLFCHPGHADALTPGGAPSAAAVSGAPAAERHAVAGAPPDPIAAARQREFAYLASPAFDADLQAAGVALGRVWQAREAEGSR